MDWDLTSYFPEFNGPEMRRFKKDLQNDIASLHKESTALPSLHHESHALWDKLFLKNDDILSRLSHLSSYLGCLTPANTRNGPTL